MIDTIVAHFNVILTFAGVAALFTGGYQRIVPNDRRIAHHHAILFSFDWIARAGWLDLMQRGVRWLLVFLDRLYGAPRPARSASVLDMLTVRSWQASAWIACFILFALPFGILTVVLPIVAARQGRPTPWDGVAVFGATFVMLCAIFVALVRREWSRPPRPLRRIDDDILADAAGMTLGYAVLAFLMVISMKFQSLSHGGTAPPLTIHNVSGVAGFLFMGVSIGLIVFYVVRSIRFYGFLAPLVFSLILAISLAAGMCLLCGAAFVTGDISQFWIKVLAATCGSCGILFAAQRFVHLRHRGARVAPLLMGAILFVIILYAADDVHVKMGVEGLMRTALAFLLWATVPYVFASYAAIYSNSLPDWLSVATTRHVLHKAANVGDIRSFVIWLLVDAVIAMACIVSTLVILLGVFYFCGMVVKATTYFGDLGDGFGSPATFFFGSIRAVTVIHDFMDGRSIADIVSGNPSDANGALLVAMLVALGATSILPTLLNAVVLLVLIAARAMAIVSRRPVSYLHSLLLIPDGDAARAGGAQLLLSSVIVGGLLTLGLAAADLVVSQLWRMVRLVG